MRPKVEAAGVAQTSGEFEALEPDERRLLALPAVLDGVSRARQTLKLAGQHPVSRTVVAINEPSDPVRPGGAAPIDRPSPVAALVVGEVSTHLEQLRSSMPIVWGFPWTTKAPCQH